MCASVCKCVLACGRWGRSLGRVKVVTAGSDAPPRPHAQPTSPALPFFPPDPPTCSSCESVAWLDTKSSTELIFFSAALRVTTAE